ncbi:MAG: hypothetical protein WKF92_07660 [Pyrinomonadaceae bacterium]
MTRAILTIFVILFTFEILKSQSIKDVDRRPFDSLASIRIDIDGDGKLDTIHPRTYRINKKQSKDRNLTKKDIRKWITFDLVTTRGRRINNFFKYNYGTAEQGGSYWVYALISAGDVNKDGKTDLLFYSGDDSSDETITLINRENRFTVLSRKVTDSDDW